MLIRNRQNLILTCAQGFKYLTGQLIFLSELSSLFKMEVATRSSILIFINPIPTDVSSNENKQGGVGGGGEMSQGPTISLLLIHGMLYIFEQRI